MEYVQMTLNDWLEIKQKLRQELLGVKTELCPDRIYAPTD